MTASSPCSDPITPATRKAGLIVLEGMPGAGKTTVAAGLAARGHSIVGEYTDDNDTTIAIDAHPGIGDDDGHQLNWLRKATQCTTRLGRYPVVYADRDWLSSLSYAYSTATADNGTLFAQRASWSERHLRDGTLLLPAVYAIFDLDPATSLARRVGRLRPGHPWNRPEALERLREFYRDPAGCLCAASTELAANLGHPDRLGVSGHDDPDSVLARLSSLARPV